MDAKSKAKFINSVAAARLGEAGNASEGEREAAITASAGNFTETAAFAAGRETDAPAKAFGYVEAKSAFAEGLPAWSIEPPQVMVRRR